MCGEHGVEGLNGTAFDVVMRGYSAQVCDGEVAGSTVVSNGEDEGGRGVCERGEDVREKGGGCKRGENEDPSPPPSLAPSLSPSLAHLIIIQRSKSSAASLTNSTRFLSN